MVHMLFLVSTMALVGARTWLLEDLGPQMGAAHLPRGAHAQRVANKLVRHASMVRTAVLGPGSTPPSARPLKGARVPFGKWTQPTRPKRLKPSVTVGGALPATAGDRPATTAREHGGVPLWPAALSWIGRRRRPRTLIASSKKERVRSEPSHAQSTSPGHT